jgi:hypothetical protein
MVDDKTHTDAPPRDSARSKRPPPTIDLEPTSSETRSPQSEAAPETPQEPVSEVPPTEAGADNGEAAARPAAQTAWEPASEPASEPPHETAAARPVSPWVIAPFSGAVAAALVIGIGWMLGWPAVQPPTAAPQLSSVVDGLNARVAGLEAKLGKPDPAIAAHLDTLDKTVAGLRGDVAGLRVQSDKTAAALNDAKAAPRDGAGTVDLSALTGRIDQLERASRSQSAALAQEDRKIAEAKTSDDPALRRVIAAALLDVAVRHGDPFAASLATARSLAPNADALKPLEAFASAGVPSPATLDRDLLSIVPKLAPQPQETTPAGTSIVDRLQAGAAKLVRIERTDGAGNDRGAVVARITAAALRNDFSEARRELKSLPPEDRAPAQAWLDKADARDAALAASRQFADDAMAALAKPQQ